MKEPILLTPGPTPLPPSVREALGRPIIHHRTKEFGKLFGAVLADLAYAYRTRESVLVMACSGTGAMEASLANLCSPGENILVVSTGAFGDRFVSIAKAYGLSPAVVKEEWGHAADPDKLTAALKLNPSVKAVFLQHTDTSTGIVNNLRELAKRVRDSSDALVVVDSISGLAAEPLETDQWGLDVVLAASQKGLMNAPGLAFATVSGKAWKAVERAGLPRFYFDWRSMKKSLADSETPYTPAVALLAGQAEALRLIRAEGIENVWKRTAELAAHARAQAAKLGLSQFPRDPSVILTSLRLPEGLDGQKLVEAILAEEGISIAGGQAHLKGKIIRLAHMGCISRADLDAGFAALARKLTPSAAR